MESPGTKRSLADVCKDLAELCSEDGGDDEGALSLQGRLGDISPELLRRRAQQLLAVADTLEAHLQRCEHDIASAGQEDACSEDGNHVTHFQRSSWLLLFGSGALACASCWSWWHAMSYDFSGGFFMDDAMIKKNANVYEDIDWGRILRTDYWGLEMFQEGAWTHKSFRPLTVLTFRWNFWLHSFDSSGFHVFNVLSHLACSALLGLFGFWSLHLPLDWSLLLATLFLAHPVHTESVLYIVGRADLLCLSLILLAALVYVPCMAAGEGGRRRLGNGSGGGGGVAAKTATFAGAFLRLTVAAALLVAAGLCKETGFCFFGLLAGWEILRALRHHDICHISGGFCLRLGALLVLGTAACAWRVWYTTGTSIERMDPQSNSVEAETSREARILSYALLHGIYGKLLVWPAFLCYDYSLDAIPLVKTIEDARLLLPITAYTALAMLLTLSLESLRKKKSSDSGRSSMAAGGEGGEGVGATNTCQEGPIVGVATVILSFAPMSNILFPVGTMIGERLLYIPSAGLLVSLVSMAANLQIHQSRSLGGGGGGGGSGQHSSSSSSSSLLLLRGFFLLAGLAAVWRCMVRIPEWRNSDSITVADALRQLRSSRVQFNYANVLLIAKRYDEALVTYQRAIDVDEEHSVQDSLPLYHAGQILFYQGHHADAVRYLEKAVTGFYSPLTIKEEEIFHDYGLALWFASNPFAAIENFQKALVMNPTFTKGLNNMGCAMGIGAITGKLPTEYFSHAVQAFDQAVRLDPSKILYWRNAIALLSGGGESQRAMTVMQQLTALDPAGGHDVDPPHDCVWEFYFR